MNPFDKKSHWENIYSHKPLTEVSWYQPVPQTSLDLISEFHLPKTAKIIDVGGGDSLLVDHLLDLGYEDITVLDISENALLRAKERLGEKAGKIRWIIADITTFKPQEKYDCWHDRAVFHFLTEENDIERYTQVISTGIREGGALILGTFAENGPTKCSGIPIRQYSESMMAGRFAYGFEKIKCEQTEHPTPFGTVQNFTFCTFRRK